MKRLYLIIVLIPLVVLMDCTDKEKKANEGENTVELKTTSSTNSADKVKNETAEIKMAPALLEKKIDEGEAFQISLDDGLPPYGFKGEKIDAMQLPDGRFYQIEKRDGKMWINVPYKGDMQVIRLSGKIYVFDDNDRAYEVKVVNNKLIAEATDLMDVLLAEKK